METSNYSIDENSTVGCGCAACQSGQPDLIDYGQNDATFSGGEGDGGSDAPSGIADPQEFATYLTHGYWQDKGGSNMSWDHDVVTFSLSNSYSADQKEGIRMAFDLWSDVADIEFNEVASGADISIVVGNDGRAYSSSSRVGTTIVSNTISIDTSVGSWSDFNDLGDYALMTILHEIGHSLGLGHTGNYNGSATYNNDAQWTNDTHQTTVMSYFSDTHVGSDHWNGTNSWQYSATPMLIDILAIQNIYGADYTTRNGNTTYGFNSNAGHDQYNFSIAEVPVAIWDGGGIDTIDLSGYSQNNVLYLTEGDFSSTGTMTNNLVIAYGAEIENAIGGSGQDTIYGNDLDNEISGGAGNDHIWGSLGDDTLDGENGDDTVQYNYSVTDFAYNFISNTVVSLTHLVQNFTDIISNIENFIFTDGTFTFDELDTAYGDLETVGVRFYWSGGGLYKYNSNETESLTVDAATMRYGGSVGDQITITRDQYDTTVTIEDNLAPNSMLLSGSTQNDTLVVDGTHNSMVVQVYAGDGDDVITISVSGNDLLYGENGNDTIDSGAGNDKIWGGAGLDILTGGAGNDNLWGGDDNDTLNGGDERDWLYGDAGDDELNGDGGSDIIRGGIGNDTIDGGDGYDRLYGQDGDDTIFGGLGNDRIYGGLGEDEISGGAGQDFIYGEDDNDTLYGGDLADYLYGGAGEDNLNGDNGNDRLYGGDDGDTLNGDAGADFLYGENGNDSIFGGNGADTIQGGAGDDILNGDAHNDRIYGGTGNDTLNGGDHDDFLNGQDDNDTLNGGDGSDTLYGESGEDILIGGAGVDTLYGGVDAVTDVFGFSASEDSEDRIYNFTLGVDQINITDLLTGYTDGVSDITEFVQIIHTGSRFDVRVDQDGGGDNFVNTARVFTDILDALTSQDLMDAGSLVANQSLA